MKTLPLEFKRDGFTHKQVVRDGNVAIYERTKPEHSQPHYEVVIIREHKARDTGNFKVEAGEHYPSSEEWGIYGWTYGTLDLAKTRLAAVRGGVKGGSTPKKAI